MSEFSLPLSEKGRYFLADLLSHDGDILGDLTNLDPETAGEFAREIRPLLTPDPDPADIAANQRTINAAKEALEGWRGVKESGDEADLQDCITDLLHLAQAWSVANNNFGLAEHVENSAWSNFFAERPDFHYDAVDI